MKKFILIVSVLVSVHICLFAFPTPKSTLFSGSYLMRSKGAEAIYWNPANITPAYQDMIIPIVNGAFHITNNALDLKAYNEFVEKDYLTNEDKDDLLKKIDRRLTVRSQGHYPLFGISSGSNAYSSSLHLYSSASISKKYMNILFYGNEEGVEYNFHQENNNAAAIAFMDLTWGKGNIQIKQLKDKAPPIRFGFATSILLGFANANTKDYSGNLSSSFDGLNASQEVTLGTSIGGIGFKGLLGAASEPIPNLHVGLTLDNIFGFINWSMDNEDTRYQMIVDSVYVSNLSDDFYTTTDETLSGSSHTTNIPMELRLGSLYEMGRASVSMDVIQGFSSSIFTSKKARLALGVELLPSQYIPISIGYTTRNDDSPWRMSYGIGVRTSGVEFGFGFQTFGSIVPSYNTKGVSISSYMNIRI